MPANNIADITMNYKDSNGNVIPMYPKTKDTRIIVSSNNGNIPSGISTIGDLLDNLGSLAFENSISIPTATTSVAGVTTLSNVTNDTSAAAEVTAATTKAVSAVNASAVHLTGNEDISGLKNFADGIILQDRIKLTVEIDENTGEPSLMFETLPSDEE